MIQKYFSENHFIKLFHYLEVCGVSELPVAVGTREPGLVGVGHQVVVEAVLASEGGAAQSTLERSETSVTPEIFSCQILSYPYI